ncbi:MAG: hypothetical protein QXL96_08305 [Ignisphaera sp.]
MPSEVVSEFILIVVIVVLGLAIFSFSFAFLLPQIAFSNAQNQASNYASSSSISVGPLLISSSSSGSVVVELYNPSYSGVAYVFAFVVPSYYQPSAGVVTPNSLPSYSVYFPNGSKASVVPVSSPIYDTSGKVIYQSPQLSLYKVLFNTPVTIVINNVNPSNIVIIWFIVNVGGYWFRIGYTYTGVPSQ